MMEVPDKRTIRNQLSRFQHSIVARATAFSISALALYAGPALAQTQQANTVCNSGGYNLFVGLVYVFMAACVTVMFASLFGGSAAKSMGWVSRSVSQSGNQAIVFSLASILILIISLTVLGIGVGNISISLPSSCVTFW